MDPLRFILDTTYILPIFGFQIDLAPEYIEEIKSLWKSEIENCKFIIPSVSLIEVMYKFNSIYKHNPDPNFFEYIPQSLPTLLRLPHITIFHCESNVLVNEMAIKIRIAGHPDIMDAYIAGSAYSLGGILLTEEKTIQKTLKLIPEFSNTQIWNWDKFRHDILTKMN
jgi:hypothetical protein